MGHIVRVLCGNQLGLSSTICSYFRELRHQHGSSDAEMDRITTVPA